MYMLQLRIEVMARLNVDKVKVTYRNPTPALPPTPTFDPPQHPPPARALSPPPTDAAPIAGMEAELAAAGVDADVPLFDEEMIELLERLDGDDEEQDNT